MKSFFEDAFVSFVVLLTQHSRSRSSSRLWFAVGRTHWLWVAWGALIGVARVFVGVHYPTDVVGGARLGTAWGALARLELPALERLARWRLAQRTVGHSTRLARGEFFVGAAMMKKL